jgi:anti-sigma B factor antagonist
MPEVFHCVRGELDYEAAGALRAALLALVNQTDGDLVLDCQRLQFIDSIGVAVIAQIRRLLAVHGRRLSIVNASAQTRRPFEVLGLAHYLDLGTASA